jgi:hypothetical protein
VDCFLAFDSESVQKGGGFRALALFQYAPAKVKKVKFVKFFPETPNRVRARANEGKPAESSQTSLS